MDSACEFVRVLKQQCLDVYFRDQRQNCMHSLCTATRRLLRIENTSVALRILALVHVGLAEVLARDACDQQTQM